MFARALFLILITSSMAAALPIGRPVAAERQWRAGVIVAAEETDMRREGTSLKQTLSSNMILGEASYGFTDDAEFVLRIGGSEEQVDGSAHQDLGSGLDWGVGIRGVMYNSYQDWRLLGDVAYLSRLGRTFATADQEISEWQAAASYERRYGRYYPYVGINLNSITINTNNPSVFRKMKSSEVLGFHLGLGIEPKLEWSLFLEAQFGHTESLSTGVHYRF